MKSFQLQDGTGLAYTDQGAGQPIVFLHPTPLDHAYWRLLTERLAGVRAISIDLRGHGGSALGRLPVGGFAAAPEAPVLSMKRLAEDVVELLDALGIEQAILAGCSIGGYVLLELWRQIPNRIKGLAFVCSKPQPDAPANAVKRADSIARANRGEMEAIFDANLLALMGEAARLAHPEWAQELRSTMKLSLEGFAAVQAGLALRPDSLPTVATITAPILAICGGKDPGITPDEMRVFAGAPGGASFHLLPEAGHFAAYEEPELVAELFAAWFKSKSLIEGFDQGAGKL